MTDIYRPLLRTPYKRLAVQIADKMNQSSMNSFDDLDICRLAIAEFWKRAFPDRQLPDDARDLLKRYDVDPNIVQSA